MIPWTREEGLYGETAFQHFLRKIGLPLKRIFIPKWYLQELSDCTNEEFEKMWEELKKNNRVVYVLVKYDDQKRIVQICEQDKRREMSEYYTT